MQPNSFPSTHGLQKAPLTPELTSLVTLTLRQGRGAKARTTLKTALRTKTQDQQLDDASRLVFYRQRVAGNTYGLASKEFCQLANSPTQSLLHLQLAISPSLPVRQDQWYAIIRYCLGCLDQAGSPAIVFSSPISRYYLDLFVLRDTPLAWEKPTTHQQWLINRMMSLWLALWLSKPVHLPPSPSTGLPILIQG